jgi:hypothetical protein
MRRLLAENSWQRTLPADLRLCGRSLQDLRSLGRNDALKAAKDYLLAVAEPLTATSSVRILAAGHQPEMFHPGVWVKNFALHGLAAAAGLTPLNILVDNDTVKSTSLALPAWDDATDATSYHVEKIPFDHWPGEVPWEECTIHDQAIFATFPNRVNDLSRKWPFRPLVAGSFGDTFRRAPAPGNLGERLAAGRRALERRWGCTNLEVPLSRLCESTAFAWFAAHLLSELPRLHTIYNETVHEYRRVHGLRSRNHPVPDLTADGDWREAPLWAWRKGAKRRGKLFVRHAENTLSLRVDGEDWPALPQTAPDFIEGWKALHAGGFKLRSRALTTTLFTRLFVADAFIHGIGGGKYDELTDELIKRFYGIEPPPFLILSATLLLPFVTFPATADAHRRLAHEMRDLYWNPQRHLQPPIDPEAAHLAEQKCAIFAHSGADHHLDIAQHQELRHLNDRLRPWVDKELLDKELQLQQLQAQLHANSLLGRRDAAFCLYPEALLRPFCQQFLSPVLQ